MTSWKHRRDFLEAQANLERNDYSKADQILSGLIESDPNAIEARLHRAYLRLRLGQLESALLDAEICVQKRPEQGVMFMALGEILLESKRYMEAYEILRKAIDHEKDNGRAYYHLGRACVALGRKAEAGDYFEMALQFERDYALAQFMSEALSR